MILASLISLPLPCSAIFPPKFYQPDLASRPPAAAAGDADRSSEGPGLPTQLRTPLLVSFSPDLFHPDSSAPPLPPSPDLASRPVSLQQRLEMMIGAARGLGYLHSPIGFSMVHRDVKPANILLDGNWQAKIADFGLTKMGEGNAYNPQDSTRVLGTPGYVDPVYGRTRKATPANDVFSFGIVMLELLTGQRAIVSVSKYEDPINISKWVWLHQQ
ncbi:unnamed protein product [Closterium sp. NIES-53]